MPEFLNYGRQTIDQDDIDAVVEVMRGDCLTQGPKVAEFERALCELTGARYCVAVSNGTAALHLAVLALELEAGCEGVTSSITFMASSNAMVYAGLKPVFSDIDAHTYCMTAHSLEPALSDATGLVIPVHFAGQPCDMGAISSLLHGRGVRVIEDAAHAIGSRYRDGTMVGNCAHSDMTIFSFHPVKTVTTGEGGAIMTNSEALSRRLRALRTHGITKDPDVLTESPGPWYHEMQWLGFNYRLSDLHAALGITQLRKLDAFVRRRREIVSAYNAAFEDVEWATPPFEAPGVVSAFHLYILLIDFEAIGVSRADAMRRLREAGVGTQVHYIPVYHQPYYKQHVRPRVAASRNAEQYYEKCLTLPLYPAMTDGDVSQVVEAVRSLG